MSTTSTPIRGEDVHHAYHRLVGAQHTARANLSHRLDAVTDRVGRALLDLHRRHGHTCRGCELVTDYAEWPCPTVLIVADLSGVNVPALFRDDLDAAKEAAR